MSSKVRVLLVDDRPENLLSLEATLLSPDYELVKVSSGGDALRYLLNNECAIILLDVQMPGMDGYETADLIKRDPKLEDIPIIFLTAINTDPGYVARGYKVGAVDYMSKPIVPEYLRAKVAVFAQLHRAKEKIIEQQQQLREHEAKEQRRRLAELELVSLRREQALHRRYRELVEGELHVVIDGRTVQARVGDVVYIPKGSRIAFGTPSRVKVFYVTYPADWASVASAPARPQK